MAVSRDADVTSGQQRRPVAESSNVASGANLLPPLMVLTVTTGVIDAVSFVGLGHVFTANMTGNVVFIGFALAGAQELSLERSLVALAAFAAGALAGGLLTNRSARPPAQLLVMAAAGEAAFLAIAAAVGFGQAIPPSWSVAHGLIVLTAIAMGLRNAIVRKLAVADVTTTVLTLTITGLAADSPIGPRCRHAERPQDPFNPGDVDRRADRHAHASHLGIHAAARLRRRARRRRERDRCSVGQVVDGGIRGAR